jgi:hypothetical protein
MFLKAPTNAKNEKLFATALKQATPLATRILAKIEDEEDAELAQDARLAFELAGYEPPKRLPGRGVRLSEADWEPPALKDWAGLHAEIETMVVIFECDTWTASNLSSKLAKRAQEKAAPMGESPVTPPTFQPPAIPTRAPSPAKTSGVDVGVTPQQLAADPMLNQLAKQAAGLTTPLAAPQNVATGKDYSLPKPRDQGLTELTIDDGQIKTSHRKLHDRETWLELNLQQLLSLSGDPEEQQLYYKYIVGLFGLAKDYKWAAVALFDDWVRTQLRNGSIASLDLISLLPQFYIRHGRDLIGSGGGQSTSRSGASGGGTSDDARQGYCSFFNGKRGCRKADCIFKHQCSVCDSKAHGKTGHKR